MSFSDVLVKFFNHVNAFRPHTSSKYCLFCFWTKKLQCRRGRGCLRVFRLRNKTPPSRSNRQVMVQRPPSTCRTYVLPLPPASCARFLAFSFEYIWLRSPHSVRRNENTKIVKQDIEPKEEKELLTSLKIVALMTKATMVRAQSLKMMWTVK